MGERDGYERVRHRLGVLAGEPAERDRPDEPHPAPDPGSPARWIPERLRSARIHPGRRGAAVLVVIGLLAAGLAMIVVWRDRPVAAPLPPLPAVPTDVLDDGAVGSTAPVTTSPTPAELVVSVVGQVQRAGLVRLPPGARVADALAAAGGPIPGADTTGVNLAQRVDDGQQIVVGGPTGSSSVGGPTGSGSVGGPMGASSVAPTGAGRVSLNRADEQELDALPGVGPVTAQAIITWRDRHGRFTDVEQLGEVDGIGPARLAKLRELVTL
ncbi:ComEA family DNA-binding protein [Skermania piniformis]|uniref:ComEA family DNA-binding protein n=1 Tax=Skermania pinensis TaxID=39122 RepID=A0ABX8SD67_9ACTN|nr:ComEA family DNA-binding protein [Skermania piniformis]QXQ14929.1 ComEA family DNA-binding protein [Skermania piniformis]